MLFIGRRSDETVIDICEKKAEITKSAIDISLEGLTGISAVK